MALVAKATPSRDVAMLDQAIGYFEAGARLAPDSPDYPRQIARARGLKIAWQAGP